MKYRVILSLEDKYSTKLLCEIAGVYPSAYYRYKRTPLKDESSLKQKVYDIYIKSGKRAGYRTIKYMLRNEYGLQINHKKVLRLMQEMDISSIIRKKYKADKGRENIKKNILNRNFSSSKPMEKLVTDITYIPCRHKMVYLSAVIDLFNNEPVEWFVSESQDKSLTINTIKNLSRKHDLNGCMIHSDQGIHYRSHDYVDLLENLGIIQSMSRRGNCWDNAKAEIFFSHFKTEAIRPRRRSFKDIDEVKEIIDSYMEYYIHHRPQKRLFGLSPFKYKEKILSI